MDTLTSYALRHPLVTLARVVPLTAALVPGLLKVRSGWRISRARRSTAATRVSAALLAALVLGSPAAARDRGADGRFDTRTSSHFVLYQDVDIDDSGGFYGSLRFEENLLDELERAYASLDRLLGLRPARKIEVVVYDPGVFDAHFRGLVRFAAAGFYEGVIRVRGATEMTVSLRRVLHHELLHAALDAAVPLLILPGWLNEGLAEWFEARALGKRGLHGGEWQVLQQAARSRALFSYASLSAPGFGYLDQERAGIAYLQSYAMIDYLVRTYGEDKLQRLVDTLIRSRNLGRSLKRVYRTDLATLEGRFFAELR